MPRAPAKPDSSDKRGPAKQTGKSQSKQAVTSGSKRVDLSASDGSASGWVRRTGSELTDGSDASDESGDDLTSNDVVPPKWAPPSGKKVSDYQGWDQWSKRQWAWEFLRRNADFQRNCLVTGLDETKVAQTYRLRRFKSFAKDYAIGRKAKFATGIHSTPKRDEFEKRNQLGSEQMQVNTLLFPAEVLIKFQLAPTRLARNTSLDAQMTQARKRLNEFAKRIRRVLPNEDRGQHLTAQKLVPEVLLAQLRLLDMEISTPSLNFVAAAELLLQNPCGEWSNREWTRKTQSGQGSALYEGAKKLQATDYLRIAVAGVRKVTSEDANTPTVKPRSRRK